MGHTDPRSDGPTGDSTCSTSTSFTDHGIERGVRLVTRTHRRLGGRDDGGFEPTYAFFDRLEEAFFWAYLGTVEEAGVPAPVEAAVDDALALAREEFADRPDADLRTEVIPWFYGRVAGFHCVYHDGPADRAADSSVGGQQD